MSDPFDNAELYDACEADPIRHETPEAAVKERVQQLLDPRTEATFDQQVLAVGEVGVTAFNREVITFQFIRSLLERLADTVSDAWAEDYGDYEEQDSLPDDAKAAFVEAIRPHVLTLLESKPVFRCVPVGDRVYSPQQVLEIMKGEES